MSRQRHMKWNPLGRIIQRGVCSRIGHDWRWERRIDRLTADFRCISCGAQKCARSIR